MAPEQDTLGSRRLHASAGEGSSASRRAGVELGGHDGAAPMEGDEGGALQRAIWALGDLK